MISIELNNLGKKYNREWIFKDLDYTIAAGQKLVVLGGNGSGKSTLLQVLSGFVMPNAGTHTYKVTNNDTEKIIPVDEIRNYIGFASPYLQLIEELTLEELIEHVRVYKPFKGDLSNSDIIARIELKHARHKTIKQFSSGMKQRLKLGLAILSNTPLLLLDEPVSNLDRDAIAWYKQIMNAYALDRTVIVCSNAITDEYFFCNTQLNIMDHKPAGR